MENDSIVRMESESLDDFLWRLGSMKDQKELRITWPELGDIMNAEANTRFTESYWRKRYASFKYFAREENVPMALESPLDQRIKESAQEITRQRVMLRDERSAYSRSVNWDARHQEYLDAFADAIKAYEPVEVPEPEEPDMYMDATIVALLSDIHYGISFSSIYGTYSPEIASRRVLQYADQIIDTAIKNRIKYCVVVLLGDLISGSHKTVIRIENKENVAQQVVGASELVSAFLYRLAKHFSAVCVHSVSGNHSRIEHDPKEALKDERLDLLIPWYCRTKLESVANVRFMSNEFDETLCVFNLYGKVFACVHGDFDKDEKSSVNKISSLIGTPVDYYCSAHMHVPQVRMERTGFIRNGACITGGDEYTIKRRLFAPAYQVYCIVTPNGVESTHYAKLGGANGTD